MLNRERNGIGEQAQPAIVLASKLSRDGMGEHAQPGVLSVLVSKLGRLSHIRARSTTELIYASNLNQHGSHTSKLHHTSSVPACCVAFVVARNGTV